MGGSPRRIVYAAVASALLVTSGCSSPSGSRAPAEGAPQTVTVTVGAPSTAAPAPSAPLETTPITTSVDGQTPPSASPTPTQDPTTPPKAPPPHTFGYTNWRSPTGNIACLADPADAVATVRCQVGEKTWSRPADAPDCDGAGAGDNAVVLGRSGPATWLCAGDYWGGPSVPVLQYGQVTRAGDIECQSLAPACSATTSPPSTASCCPAASTRCSDGREPACASARHG